MTYDNKTVTHELERAREAGSSFVIVCQGEDTGEGIGAEEDYLPIPSGEDVRTTVITLRRHGRQVLEVFALSGDIGEQIGRRSCWDYGDGQVPYSQRFSSGTETTAEVPSV